MKGRRKGQRLETLQEFERLLRYDAASGEFVWLVSPGGRLVKAGDKAGTRSGDHVMITISGNQYPAGRLAVLFMTGKWPSHAVTHADGNSLNNAWSNLRDLPTSQLPRLPPKSERPVPSIERLREAFRYDPDTGELFWLINRRGQAHVGDIAGRQDALGYWSTTLDQKRLMVHRVAWALSYGSWPDDDIDHIDGNPSNNRLANLRAGTRSQNMQNRKGPQVNNSSGYLGVMKIAGRNLTKPWKAVVRVGRQAVWSERFATAEEAHASYLEAKRRLHPFNTL